MRPFWFPVAAIPSRNFGRESPYVDGGYARQVTHCRRLAVDRLYSVRILYSTQKSTGSIGCIDDVGETSRLRTDRCAQVSQYEAGRIQGLAFRFRWVGFPPRPFLVGLGWCCLAMIRYLCDSGRSQSVHAISRRILLSGGTVSHPETCVCRHSSQTVPSWYFACSARIRGINFISIYVIGIRARDAPRGKHRTRAYTSIFPILRLVLPISHPSPTPVPPSQPES